MLQLKDFQKAGVQTLLKKKRHILADEMGLGKTPQTICTVKWLPKAEGKWIIVAPKTLGRVWKNEIDKWYPQAKSVIVKGSRVDKGVQIMSTDAKFIILTYESLDSLLEVLMNHVEIAGFIADEAHKLKSRDAKMHKAFAKLQEKFSDKYLFLLTGTPLMNRVEELWSLLHMIDPGQYSNFHLWANSHLKEDKTYIPGQGWVKQYDIPRNPEAFKDYVSTYVLRRLKKDNIDLPDKTYVTHECELEGEQWDLYCSMRDSYYIQWEAEEGAGNELTATAMIAAITRLKQIAISVDLLRDKDKMDHLTLPLTGAKIDAVEELIDEAVSSGQKVVVFSQFAQCMQRLAYQFRNKWKCEVMTGDNTENQRNDAIKRFQEGDSEVFFIGTQVGGVGITLTSASVCIFMDLMWNPALNAQAGDRLHRIGQKNPVTIYYLKGVDTIEDYILGVLAKKEELFEMVMPEARFDNVTRQMVVNWRQLLGK